MESSNGAKYIRKSKGHSFSSLMISPKNVRFVTQDKGERIFVIARQSFITNIPWIFNSIFYLLLAPVVYLLLFYYFGSLLNTINNFLTTGQLTLVIAVYFLIIYSYTVNKFITWYFNVYIITSQRIIDYDFVNFSGLKVAEANLVNIEDVTQVQKGLLRSIFNYGDLTIQTAAERMQFSIINVPNPSYIRNVIVDMSTILKKESPFADI